MYTCCLPNFCGRNPHYMIMALLFSHPKSPDVDLAEPISDWSDPGQLTFVSYPVYVSSVPGNIIRL